MADSRLLVYHRSVRDEVLRYIRERGLLRAGDRVCTAVSGGADSVALLRVLLELRDELGIVLSLAHFNHLLRGDDSEADEAFVADLATHHGLECFSGRGSVSEYALERKLSLEVGARELRYRWLVQVAGSEKLDAIATGHTLDDQAETVLMKFLRGAGTRGLAGIYPEIKFRGPSGARASDSLQHPRIVRPLLGISRAEVEAYLTSIGQAWREDESNLDPHFTRNRVRHELLPLLERDYNPNIRMGLSEAAEVARGEEEYWEPLVERELHERIQKPGSTLQLEDFVRLPLALQRRTLEAFRREDGNCRRASSTSRSCLRCAAGAIARTKLPGGWVAVRVGNSLELQPPEAGRVPASLPDYRYVLPIPGEVPIAELGLTLRALIVPNSFARAATDTDLLAADLVGPELTVRNWLPGDRFCPAHSRFPEKLKRLFAEKRIPAEQRAAWPVILDGGNIVWARGFPPAREYQWQGKGDAVQIELIPYAQLA